MSNFWAVQRKPVYHRATSYHLTPLHLNAPFNILNVSRSLNTPPVLSAPQVTNLQLHWESTCARADPAPSTCWVPCGYTPAIWPASKGRWNRNAEAIAFCSAEGLTDICLPPPHSSSYPLSFPMIKLPNGFKKLSGDMEKEKKTDFFFFFFKWLSMTA